MDDNSTALFPPDRNCSNETLGNETSCSQPRPAFCYALATTPDWSIYLHAACVCLLMVTSIVANLLVLLLVAKYKKLRTRSVIMTLSVVVADLLLVFSVHLPAFSSLIALSFPFKHEGCLTFGFLSRNAIVTRFTIMGMLSIERLCAVRFPYLYKRHSRIVIAVLFLIGWVAPAVLSGIAVLLKAKGVFRVNFPTCIISCPQVIGQTVCKLFGNISLAIFIVVGSILPLIIYIYLYCVGRKIKKRTQVAGVFAESTTKDPSEPRLDAVDIEHRASITFGILFATVFATSVPFDISLIIGFISTRVWCSAPLFLHFAVVEILISATTMDPIFILRDQDFRWCLKDFFCCGKKRNVDFITSEDFSANGRRQSLFSDSVLQTKKRSDSLHGRPAEDRDVALTSIKAINGMAVGSLKNSLTQEFSDNGSSQAASDEVLPHICSGGSPE